MDRLAEIVDLERYPLHRPQSSEWHALVERCRRDLQEHGMYELVGFVEPAVLAATVATLLPRMATESFEQNRIHNIWFDDNIQGVAADHPGLARVHTINHTLCGDQLLDTMLTELYEWPHFREFVAATMQMPVLHLMEDRLPSVNVLSYRPGEALNWHFDRSVFTTTMLLQAADEGGVFQYRRELRSDDDPNFDGVGRLLAGEDPEVIDVHVRPGALNVFRGHHTPHRVTTVAGARERMVAVFSLYDRPGVVFSDEENLGFYGRTS